MRRRDFVFGLAGAFDSLPAFSQQRAVPVIGYFGVGSPGPFADRMAAFRDGLRRGGFVEGRNVVIEYRWTEEGYNQLPKIRGRTRQSGCGRDSDWQLGRCRKGRNINNSARVLVRWRSSQIGFGSSLNKPGANLTGVSLFASRSELSVSSFFTTCFPTRR